jgi:hypothetical protein
VPFARLAEEEKTQNRDLVRDIPTKLAMVGYAMRPARSGAPAFEFTEEEVEVLAEREHERWVRAKLIAGYVHGAGESERALTHPALLPWRELPAEHAIQRYGRNSVNRIGTAELPEEQREKDRDLVRGIARILATAGYTATRAQDKRGS